MDRKDDDLGETTRLRDAVTRENKRVQEDLVTMTAENQVRRINKEIKMLTTDYRIRLNCFCPLLANNKCLSHKIHPGWFYTGSLVFREFQTFAVSSLVNKITSYVVQSVLLLRTSFCFYNRKVRLLCSYSRWCKVYL